MDKFDWPDEEPDETTFAQGRLAGRTYASRSFPLVRPGSADHGQPARFVYKVFDPDSGSMLTREGEEWIVAETPAGRFQVKLLVAREAGHVKELWIQRVPARGDFADVTNVVHLSQPEASTLAELLKLLPSIPVEGETSVRVDDSLVQDLFASPEAIVSIYNHDPERFRALISNDASAKDVVAVAARRSEVERFRRLLNDDAYFDAEAADVGGEEAVWQGLFERNPWIFGVGLAGQFLTSWNEERLEQVVVGHSISGIGKRADALLRTAGRVRSMVFTEIKTHRAPLLGAEYRSGCWSPSPELAGGVVQLQGTTHRAVAAIGHRLADVAEDGSDLPGSFTYLLRPRSYLIIGALGQLVGEDGGDHQDRIRSFELFRRNLGEPEVVTFDELLERAEWVVETSD